MNLLEQARADIEARRNEPVPAQRPEGALLSEREFETRYGSSPAESELEATPTAAAPKPARGLAGKSYARLFRSELEPEVVPFEVDGHPCLVALAPLSRELNRRYLDEFGQQGSKKLGSYLCDQSIFLVANTVLRFELWHEVQTAEGLQWQEIHSAETPGAREQQFRQMGDALDWWGDLVAECQRINGHGEDASGN